MEHNPVTPRRLTEGGGRGRRETKKKKTHHPVTPSDSFWLENFFSAVVLKPGGSFLLAQEQ